MPLRWHCFGQKGNTIKMLTTKAWLLGSSYITNTKPVLAPSLLKHQEVEMAWAGAAIQRIFLKPWLNSGVAFSPISQEHHLVASSFSFALPNIFHIRVSLTSVSSSPPVRPWAGAVRWAVLYFQLLYRSCALSSHAGVCVPAVATAETQGKSSLCHYLISLSTVSQLLLGCKWSMICSLRAFQTSKYFLI